MREERTIHLGEIPIGGKDGLVWNRLHGEREEICETLLKEPTYIERQIMQSRLRKVDDALDRLMSGSYGYCSRCGREIESVKLAIDAAVALCRDCRDPKQSSNVVSEKEQSETDEVLLESLNPFDTILLRTHNNEYRILLLDPQTGRALVEGGDYLVEPNEALLRGSAVPGAEFKAGWICAGARLEIWVDERVLLTSAIKSVHVKHNSAAESVEDISSALH